MNVFEQTKSLFHLPANMIYLDGNSLGPLPKKAAGHIDQMLNNEWGEMLITGWNKADWMGQPARIGDRIGKLIGAPAGSVVMGDTLSIKVYQAVASALELNPFRKVVLSDNGNFPSDLYMVDGLLKSLNDEHKLQLTAPQDVESALSEEIAVLMLTEVDYRTGRKHDMQALTKKAHSLGIIVVWDLAHSAGALEVDVTKCNADFAVGCTYKYINGGPGSPAFIYVAPRLHDQVRPALSGWMGHEAPFAFDVDYRAGQGIERMRVGTPPVIALTALESSLDIWDMVSMSKVRQKSIELCDLFIEEVEKRCPELTLNSPRNGDERGSQVTFKFKHGYAAMQALISKGVIGDFRAPDNMRFGFTPLYIDENDVLAAVDILDDVINNDVWDNPEFKQRSRVT